MTARTFSFRSVKAYHTHSCSYIWVARPLMSLRVCSKLVFTISLNHHIQCRHIPFSIHNIVSWIHYHPRIPNSSPSLSPTPTCHQCYSSECPLSHFSSKQSHISFSLVLKHKQGRHSGSKYLKQKNAVLHSSAHIGSYKNKSTSRSALLLRQSLDVHAKELAI